MSWNGHQKSIRLKANDSVTISAKSSRAYYHWRTPCLHFRILDSPHDVPMVSLQGLGYLFPANS